MATNKKKPAAPVAAEVPVAAAPVAPKVEAAPAAPEPSAVAGPAVTEAVATKAAVSKAKAKPTPKPRPAKAMAPSVEETKAVLAKAVASAKTAKIEQPLGKPAKSAKLVKADKEPKAPKAKKEKLVRDSFTMPEGEYAQIASLKKRLLDKGVVAKKSELLRAGIALLTSLGDVELTAAMEKVEIIKTGRPAKAGK